MRGRAQDPDPAGGVPDDRQHVQAGAGQSYGLEEIAGKQSIAWERRKSAQLVEARSGAGPIPACYRIPHRGGGDPDPEDEQFAMNGPVAPTRILPCQAQHQQDGDLVK